MQHELQQKDLFYGFNRLAIKNGKYLNVDRKQTARRLKYCIDLVSLNPESQLDINIAWQWLVALIISGLFLFTVLWFSTQIFTAQLNPYKFYLIATPGILCVIFLFMFYIASKRTRIFTSRHSGYPLVEVFVGKPSHKRYTKFIDVLENDIIVATQNRHLNKANQRAGELKMLRRLSKEGVVSKTEYENCKYVLLRG